MRNGKVKDTIIEKFKKTPDRDKAVYIIILVVGIIFIIFAVILGKPVELNQKILNIAPELKNMPIPNYPMLSNFFLSIGTAFTTSSLLFLLYLLFSPIDKNDVFEEFLQSCIQDSKILQEAVETYNSEGIISIQQKQDFYSNLDEILTVTNDAVECNMILSGGLKELCNQDEILKRHLTNRRKKPLQVKILTINPYAPFLVQAALDEKYDFSSKVHSPRSYNQAYVDSEELSGDIKNLESWVNDVKRHLGKGCSIEIKFFNSLPSIQYHRIYDSLLVSFNLIGRKNQKDRAVKYKKGSVGFEDYEKYFNALWEDSFFSFLTPRVNLNPHLFIGDKWLSEIMKDSCLYLEQEILRKTSCCIRAILTICDYPSLEKRTDAIETFSDGTIKIAEPIREHIKEDETQVAGRSIQTKQILFEPLTDEISIEKNKCAVLSIPILDSQTNNVLIAITYDFYKGSLGESELTPKSDENINKHKDIVDEANRCARYIAAYLHINSAP